MAQPGTITMSMRELDRLKVIQAVIEERLMPWRAAERLGLSRRQVERLTVRYRSQGASGLLSRYIGLPPRFLQSHSNLSNADSGSSSSRR
ncbi:Helix-turn-helix domain-containing protein [Burkholderia sp. GAS332]|nr:Helix-turn-helix domain-containing protein [Burkholderia sp. GAS332]